MWKQHRDNDSKSDGFTLIELLIVIIILGILAAIVVFAIGSTRKDAVANSCKTDAKSIQLSLEAQKTKNGSYPTQAASAVPASGSDVINPAKGALLRSWPGGTAATSDYRFQYLSAAGTTYTVAIDGASVTSGSFSDSADLGSAC